MRDSSESRFNLSENGWLALIPILATYLVFLFQGSYFSYFGVPMSLIDVDAPKIIFSMAALVVVGFFAAMLFVAVADLLKAQNPIVRIFGRGLLGLVLFSPLIVAAVDINTMRQNLMIGSVMVLAWLINFLPPSQKACETKTYLDRLREQEDNYGKASMPQNAKQVFGEKVIAPFSLVVLFSIYVMMLGVFCASVFGGATYLKENPNALYVGRTGGAYVFTLIDPETNTFGSEVLLISDDKKIELVRGKKRATRRVPSQ